MWVVAAGGVGVGCVWACGGRHALSVRHNKLPGFEK